MSEEPASTAVSDADADSDTGGVDSGSPARDIDALRTVASYQFGAEAGTTLFPADESFEIRRSTGGRPRQVHTDDARLVSYGVDGRFTLGIAGGRRLLEIPAPANRVVVGDDSEPFVREGKNVFAKFVSEVDPEIRPGDEVLVVHERGELLAVGRAELSADGMADFDSGMAVKVREGVDD
ncbi:PUA domain-containing protein [Halohasta litorea]|uniref:PUA domain-containing protein n=1 Tax=Halohasta litorea TaxID=869891 RepID=A0ABD6D4G2_9EURY|nr:PUA domain-containing protein [Halohasta litorea]